MRFIELRNELKEYYWLEADKRVEPFYKECCSILDNSEWKNMTPYGMKAIQYKTIADLLHLVVFENSPFYYETGTMPATCDGSRCWQKIATDCEKDKHFKHPGGWTYFKNEHLFVDNDEKLWKVRCEQGSELFYLVCGYYNDDVQHFNFNYRAVLQNGLKNVYEKAMKALLTANNDEEKDFLNSVKCGMIALKTIAEKFSRCAKEKYDTATAPDVRKNLKLIYETAARVPWEKQQTFYEALNTYAFMRKAIGTLEGIGTNTFGRIDMDLYPFYQADIEKGILNKETAYELICKFLITFDCHYDPDKKMIGYADHEFENTYVLGGCDENGNPFYNEITEIF